LCLLRFYLSLLTFNFSLVMTSTTKNKQESIRAATAVKRRLPVGAEVIPGDGAHFRVWAPLRRQVEVVLEDVFKPDHHDSGVLQLASEENGYFSGTIPAATAGTLYRYRLDGGQELFPDPASRFQPLGPHGPSQVIDPSRFIWSDREWRGIAIEGQVMYEMHIGTFTPEGTWKAACLQLPELAQTGITALEIMPVADFPGRFGWGYDGVDFYAPTRLYGTPDEFREFVNTAHSLGLAVVLDVVYNHQGPDGCYLPRFSQHYFTERYRTEWGSAFNFDGEHSGPVREFILANARYWIEEFHLDGLRLDATQSIFDNSSPEHIMAALTRTVRESAGERLAIVTGENEPQDAGLALSPDRGGFGLDGLWNDDFHHSARVALTGAAQAYYSDYRGTPQELISAAKWGYLFQGQHYQWQQKKRGTSSLWLKPQNFIVFIENHDQVANSAKGERIHQLTSPGRYRAATVLLLLMPGTPLLFQGQEFACSSPFLYFADLNPAVAGYVKKGRKQFLSQFQNLAAGDVQNFMADPADPAAFERSKLDFSERERNQKTLALHRDLLRLRREDPVFRVQRCRGVDGAVLGPEAFVLRYFEEQGKDRLLIVNFGREIDLRPAPEPLLAPPEKSSWQILLSSEDLKYGGSGTAPVESEGRWRIPGHATVVMKHRKNE
jgi:maltooligosyltrehalose trehalohydrolase